MTAIEGRVGEPRSKYIRTAVSGIWGRPTNLNNVETWANVPLIINKGADWFTTIGTDNSKGTKIFSLVGKVNNSGLVEVPMGTTIRQIVFDIGGGMPPKEASQYAESPLSIHIGENAWIGARAILLGGARIGEGSIVGAGCVVDFTVPPYRVVAGNPARVVGMINRDGRNAR